MPVMQVCQHVRHLPGTLCTLRASSSTAPYAAGFSQTYGQGCTIVQALMHTTTPLPRPTCPLLDCIPSIKVSTFDDMDILGDIELSLFHTRHHP